MKLKPDLIALESLARHCASHRSTGRADQPKPYGYQQNQNVGLMPGHVASRGRMAIHSLFVHGLPYQWIARQPIRTVDIRETRRPSEGILTKQACRSVKPFLPVQISCKARPTKTCSPKVSSSSRNRRKSPPELILESRNSSRMQGAQLNRKLPSEPYP